MCGDNVEILCSECGETLAKLAPACPNCGCPREVSEPASPDASAARSTGARAFRGLLHVFITLPIGRPVASLVLLQLIGLGCGPDPIEEQTQEVKLPAAEESLVDETAVETSVTKKIRENAEALCTRKSAEAERALKQPSWFSCNGAVPELPNAQPACRIDQIEAAGVWLGSLQDEAIQKLGQGDVLACLQEGMNAGIPTLGRLPSPEDWLTDYVLVNHCARNRIEKARAEASP